MKIVVLDGYTTNPGDLSWEPLRALGDLSIYPRTGRDQIIERSGDADIILTNGVPLKAETIQALNNVRYICVLATGYNHVDVEEAAKRGITVSNSPGYSTFSVSQSAIALLLHLTQHVKDHADAVRQGKWKSCKDDCFWNFGLTELYEKTLGVIGLGTIGIQTARIAEAMGMRIISSSPRPKKIEELHTLEWVGMEKLFTKSDVITLHCPLTPETRGLVNKEHLSLMKKSAFLINTARGGLIDEEDLAWALNNEIIAGAGLDVLSKEPPRDSNPLITAKNCYITPHNAWATREARSRLISIAAENVSSFLAGRPINVVGQ
jgi:glycerate dehydrogenase